MTRINLELCIVLSHPSLPIPLCMKAICTFSTINKAYTDVKMDHTDFHSRIQEANPVPLIRIDYLDTSGIVIAFNVSAQVL